MPKPPVKIGNVYESKDRREAGRRVRVDNLVPGETERWFCTTLYESGREGPEAKLSSKNLQSRWKLVEEAGDTLQALLTRMKDVHPSDLAPSLVPLRSAWLKAGCPGLRKP